jgi:hypothetical protein
MIKNERTFILQFMVEIMVLCAYIQIFTPAQTQGLDTYKSIIDGVFISSVIPKRALSESASEYNSFRIRTRS